MITIKAQRSLDSNETKADEAFNDFHKKVENQETNFQNSDIFSTVFSEISKGLVKAINSIETEEFIKQNIYGLKGASSLLFKKGNDRYLQAILFKIDELGRPVCNENGMPIIIKGFEPLNLTKVLSNLSIEEVMELVGLAESEDMQKLADDMSDNPVFTLMGIPSQNDILTLNESKENKQLPPSKNIGHNE